MRGRRLRNSILEVSPLGLGSGAFALPTVRRQGALIGRDQPARWGNRPRVGADVYDRPLMADTVEKVENRTAPEISPWSISRYLKLYLLLTQLFHTE